MKKSLKKIHGFYRDWFKDRGYVQNRYLKKNGNFYYRKQLDENRFFEICYPLSEEIGEVPFECIFRGCLFHYDIVNDLKPHIGDSWVDVVGWAFGLEMFSYSNVQGKFLNLHKDQDLIKSAELLDKHLTFFFNPIIDSLSSIESLYLMLEKQMLNWQMGTTYMRYGSIASLVRLYLRAKLKTPDFFEFAEKIHQHIAHMRQEKKDGTWPDELEVALLKMMPSFTEIHNDASIQKANVELFDTPVAIKREERKAYTESWREITSERQKHIDLRKLRAEFWDEVDKGNNPKMEWDLDSFKIGN